MVLGYVHHPIAESGWDMQRDNLTDVLFMPIVDPTLSPVGAIAFA